MEPTGYLDNLRGLSTADYLKAESKLTIEEKSALATGLASALNAHSGEAHFTEAEAILRLLIWNAEPHVVEAVGKAVASNPNAPKSIAWALANDDEAAALPILEACAALSDDDLLAIVEESGNFSKMGAIARRSIVSEQISRSLVQRGDESTMQSLLANAMAVIPDDAFGQILDRFSESESVHEGVANRESLSSSILQRLIESAPPDLAAKLALRHQAQQMPGYLEEESGEELDRKFQKLLDDRTLNESVLVHNLCQGNFDFFCRALAALTNSENDQIRKQMLESPAAHLLLYWEMAKLPRDWLPIASAAASAVIHIDQNYSKADRQLFSRNIIERIVATLKSEKFPFSEFQKRFFARHGVRL